MSGIWKDLSGTYEHRVTIHRRLSIAEQVWEQSMRQWVARILAARHEPLESEDALEDGILRHGSATISRYGPPTP